MGNPERSNKALRRKKTTQKVIAAVSVAILAIVAVVIYFRRDVQKRYGNRSLTKVETVEVTNGSVRTTVSGSGALTSEDVQDVNTPGPVTVDTVYVEAGDSVKEGNLLASVSTSSVLSALSDVQDQLDALDKELKNTGKDSASTRISAGVSGRLKAIYADVDDDVADVMYEHGALAVISLDGHMAVDLESDTYQAGDTVTVETSDGTSYEGTVDKVIRGTATILITDNGPLNGDTVKVEGKDSGELYIHSPLKVTGYAGTVTKVTQKENANVNSATNLFNLKDTAYSAKYDKILKDRAEYEEVYQTLVKMYKDGGIVAPVSGVVENVVDEEHTAPTTASASSSSSLAAYAAMGYDVSAYSASAASTPASATASSGGTGLLDENLVLTIDPQKTMSITIEIDETDILSLELNQEAAITVDSIGEDTYTGTVTDIDTSAASASGVTTYTATITLDRAEYMLPGMTADVAVTINGVENAMILPEDAVQKTAASAFVYTSYDEETDTLGGMVEVTVGLSNGKFTEITGGLKPGDTVFYIPKEKTFTFGNFTFTTNGGGMGGSRGNAPRG